MASKENPVEIRLFCSPEMRNGNTSIVKNILGGISDYLKLRDVSSNFLEKDWGMIKGLISSNLVENEFPINCGGLSYINADKILRILSKEKIDISHKLREDIPHWDIILTPDYLVANEGGTIYGKSTNYIHKKDSLASIIISTADLKKEDELFKEKAFVLGNRYALLTEGECSSPNCLGSYIDYHKLDKIAKNYKETSTIPLCGIKHKK
jgi:hypothetical protein